MVMVPGSLFFKMFNKRVEALPVERVGARSKHHQTEKNKKSVWEFSLDFGN